MVKKPENAPEFKLSWEDVMGACKVIVIKLNEYEFKYGYRTNLVVGIPRGGIIPGALVARMMKVPFTTAWQGITVEHKNVLIVDDILDTGVTMEAFQNMAKAWTKYYEIKPRILIAAMCQKRQSKIKTAYHGFDVKDNEWVVFPWELNE